MADRAFCLRLPTRGASAHSIAEFHITRVKQSSQMARRARLFAALAGVPAVHRGRFAKAVSLACRLLTSAGRSAYVRFGIRDLQSQTLVEVSISTDEDIRRPVDWPDAMYAKLTAVGHSLSKFEILGPASAPSGIVIAMATSGSVPIPQTAAVWRELLAVDSLEDAIVIAEKRLKRAESELSVFRSQGPSPDAVQQLANDQHNLETLSLAVTHATNSILVMDDQGQILWTNDAFVKLTGYSAAEAIGHRIDELLFGPSTPADSIRDFQEALRNGHEFSQDVLQYNRDGRTFWVECRLIPMHDEEGRLTRWVALQNDVTRRRQTEEALRAAKQAAEESSRAKSEFLANMSHEIRTPLNAILGMTELSLATDLTPQQRDYLRTVQSSGETLLQLLSDVLDLSKIEAGKMALEQVEFNLADAVRETVKALSAAAQSKGITLSVQMPRDVPQDVRGDPTRFRQILFNLVGNAIKFTERGEVAVEVQEQWRAEDEISLHFSVQDTGIGIPKEKLQQIFESFTQADSSIARRFGGSGLGLAITSQLLGMMHGKIWVQSKIGQGSTFHFTIKLGLPHTTDIAEQGVSNLTIAETHGPAEASANGNSSSNRRRRQPDLNRSPRTEGDNGNQSFLRQKPARALRILVADDYEPNRHLAIEILERRGHHCEAAADGNQAIAATADGRFDAVLMDVQMPGLDGFSATQEIRKREKGTAGHVPIIALTAHALVGDREKCLVAGMDAYLAKPIRASELIAMVEAVTGITPSRLNDVTSTSASEPTVPFDIRAALERMGGEMDLLQEHIAYMLHDIPELMERMRKAITRRDARLLEISAHRLKSLVSSYDYHPAQALAARLEGMGKESQFDGAPELLAELDSLIASFLPDVKAYLAPAFRQ